MHSLILWQLKAQQYFMRQLRLQCGFKCHHSIMNGKSMAAHGFDRIRLIIDKIDNGREFTCTTNAAEDGDRFHNNVLGIDRPYESQLISTSCCHRRTSVLPDKAKSGKIKRFGKGRRVKRYARASSCPGYETKNSSNAETKKADYKNLQ